MQFARVAFHISLLLAVQQAIIASDSALSSLVRKDVLPSTPRWKTIVSSSKAQCASYCLSTSECKSFYFGHDECGLLKTQYSANDKMLDKMVGFSYYHFNARYYETLPETTTPESTTTAELTTTELTTAPQATTPNALSYIYHAEEVTFGDAFKSCKDKKTRLVCIHDDTTWQAILQVIKDNGSPRLVWIGLNGTVHTPGTKYDLEWTDGVKQNQNTKFQQWVSTKFPGNKLSCVEISSKKWKDQLCSSPRPYICEHIH